VQKRLDAEEAKALKKLRKRWRKSAHQLDVDEWIAREEWRRRPVAVGVGTLCGDGYAQCPSHLVQGHSVFRKGLPIKLKTS